MGNDAMDESKISLRVPAEKLTIEIEMDPMISPVEADAFGICTAQLIDYSIDQGKSRPKVKIRKKCLRSQSTSQLPQLGNGGLCRTKGLIVTKGMRKVHSSSSCYRMSSEEEQDTKVK